MFGEEEQRIVAAIEQALADLGYPPRAVELRRIPFSGEWGAATTVAKALAGQVAAETAGLSKKEAKERGAAIVAATAQEIAEQLAGRLREAGVADSVEAVNGLLHIKFEAP